MTCCNQKYSNYLLDEIKFNKKAFHQKFEHKTTDQKKLDAASSSIMNNIKNNYLSIIKKFNPNIYTQILLHQEVQQFKSKLRATAHEYKLKFGAMPKSMEICEELLIIFAFLINESDNGNGNEQEEEQRLDEIINSANLEYENLKNRNGDNIINSLQKNLLKEALDIFDKIKQFKLEKRKTQHKRKNSLGKIKL
ncbi:13969_t:CDS:1 [Entrophospora sp. SA101]|nr:12063_t:CDS:1 [Entrophospora sp. SA101]CAJ0634403.1 977_t:CDS:1 [Entrophospora sp. SA101]CAJ0747205.1 13969_t:CDS:1 [Entrophospora sp. SA101]CAJ0826838.1 8538_t:CDS:1 [Entrophospora sp. SA101]CAJ0848964.1 4084_t:CDS:1 [Entrophospora sp. SA101]